MTYILALVAGIGFVEILLRTPLLRALQALRRTAGRAGHVVRSARISDHWKERVLLAYSGRLFVSTVTIALSLLAAAIPLLLAILIGAASGIDFAGFVVTLPGMAVLTLVALAYAGFRFRVGRRSETGSGRNDRARDYGFGARLLHRLALGSTSIAEASFDIEQAGRARAKPLPDAGAPVFVAGLARAGTTVLMRSLHASGAFCSLTYRDMPFVLAPNLWRRLSSVSRLDRAARERAHGDGLAVDFDSPEAFEEVFWRVFCGDRYITADRLLPMIADEEEADKFRGYVDAIRAGHPGKRYLSKNNNNILRLSSLFSAFPEAQVLIPFRAPLQHAASLRRQHMHFRQMHAEDPFARRYMHWLVHHEFGADHRPFVFDGPKSSDLPDGNPDTLDYWLALWVDTYSALLETAPPACRFICYESLCEDPAVWSSLCAALALPEPYPEPGFTQAQTAIDVPYDGDLATRADALYHALRARGS